MRTTVFAALLLLMGCQLKPDFSQLKEQMTAAETVALVGEPTKKTPFLFDTELWLYEEPNVLLTMQNDTVKDVNRDAKATIEQVGKGLEHAPEELDSLLRSNQ